MFQFGLSFIAFFCSHNLHHYFQYFAAVRDALKENKLSVLKMLIESQENHDNAVKSRRIENSVNGMIKFLKVYYKYYLLNK